MDNLRATIDVLFNHVGGEQILKSFFNGGAEDALYDSLWASGAARKTAIKGSDWFCRTFQECEDEQTDNQAEAVYDLLTNKWVNPPDNNSSHNGRSPFNVLLHFTKDVLCLNTDEPVCRYEHLFRWHTMSNKVGQDMLTTATLAANDAVTGTDRHFFGWKAIIGHDNNRINDIMSLGVAELHFHLKGSSLNFDVNWLCLMNHILDRRKSFDRLKARQMPIVSHFERRGVGETLYSLCVKACAIRLLLFSELRCVGGLIDRRKTMDLLKIENLDELTTHMQRLQDGIDVARHEYGRHYGPNVVDYAIRSGSPKPCYDFLAGEREILYLAFRKVFAAGDGSERDTATAMLLYAYLSIKCQLRKEFLQLNKRVGFGNFDKYEARKTLFIKKDSVYDALITYCAIRSLNENRNYLEARITPQDSDLKLAQAIKKLEGHIHDPRFTGAELNFPPEEPLPPPENVSYILHFIKCTDKEYLAGCCRHIELRDKVKLQAHAIDNLLRSIQPEGNRIVGIDAANTELGCRPEVFAQAFRFLRDHNRPIRHQCSMPQEPRHIGATYHVGEDFMDLIDGLRAVDEAILFLNLKDGDRLGHALALGLNAEDYYTRVHKTVICTKIDCLDNIAWLSEKIKCRITHNRKLQIWLRRQFSTLFCEIYECTDVPTMHTYYQSWLLRGDNPERYLSHLIEPAHNSVMPWDGYDLNHGVPEIVTARHSFEARKLCHLYHYDETVRKNGNKTREFKIDDNMYDKYVACVRDLQVSMRREIVRRRIAIETNPSSNLMIGGLERYDKHPITTFYNKGLCNFKCWIPKIPVSINTDDQGIFHTSLENEFALMGLAIEKKKKKKKRIPMPQHRIFSWLDNVRKLAFEHRFDRLL